MNEKTDVLSHISQLIGQLAAEDAVVRQESREQLIQPGSHDVTRAVVTALIDPRTRERLPSVS